MIGTCKFFNAARGFGFVQNEGGEWWFHGTRVIGPIPPRYAEVDFLLDDGRRGDLVAVAVRVRGGESEDSATTIEEVQA